MKEKNAFLGIFFIMLAVIVIVIQVADLSDVDADMFTLIASIVLLMFEVDGIRRKNIYEIIFAIAFLIILHLDTLGIKGLTPLGVLTAALLESIGFSFLFPGNRRKKTDMKPEPGADNTDSRQQGD